MDFRSCRSVIIIGNNRYRFLIEIFLYIFFQLITPGVYSLRNVRVTIPDAVELDSNAILICKYDLDREPLYTLKWYKGEQEFFRYTPRETPSIKVFDAAGLPELKVVKEESNASQVVLKKVVRNMSGRYICEVTTDAPSFHAVHSEGEMQVVNLPTDLPQIRHSKQRYRNGEKINVTCKSLDSKPAANLTWTVDNRALNNDYTVKNSVTINPTNGMESSGSTLSFVIREDHFRNNNAMKIKCTASIYSIYQKVSEVSVLMDKRYIYQPETRQNPVQITTTPDLSSRLSPPNREGFAEVFDSSAETIHRVTSSNGNNLLSYDTPGEIHNNVAHNQHLTISSLAFLLILVQLFR